MGQQHAGQERARSPAPRRWAASLCTVIGRGRATGATLALATSLASCTQVSDRDRFEAEETPLRILQTVPRPGALDVTPLQQLEVCLSSRIDPRSVGEGDTAIGSGSSVFDTELSVQLVPWTAPGGVAVAPDAEGPWCAGSVLSISPQTPLTPGARFRMQLVPRARGWAGQPLSTEETGWVIPEGGDEPRFFLEFTVTEDDAPPAEPEDDAVLPISLTELFETGGPFDPARELCSCHAEVDTVANARLDLRDASLAFEDLLRAQAEPQTGFAMVAPRDPTQSFLIHKLLRDDDGEALHGILGDAMPPQAQIPYADFVAIARWIEDGANP